jgi:hypothetical protein
VQPDPCPVVTVRLIENSLGVVSRDNAGRQASPFAGQKDAEKRTSASKCVLLSRRFRLVFRRVIVVFVSSVFRVAGDDDPETRMTSDLNGA